MAQKDPWTPPNPAKSQETKRGSSGIPGDPLGFPTLPRQVPQARPEQSQSIPVNPDKSQAIGADPNFVGFIMYRPWWRGAPNQESKLLSDGSCHLGLRNPNEA